MAIGYKTGGRKRGSRNKKTIAHEAALAAIAANPEMSPVEFLLSIVRNPDISPALRVTAAAHAAKYIHVPASKPSIEDMKVIDAVETQPEKRSPELIEKLRRLGIEEDDLKPDPDLLKRKGINVSR
jgi:hypothetical protein